MKTVRFAAYLFYRYYSKGATKDIPYASTLCALVMLFGLHLLQVLVLIDKVSFIMGSNNTKIESFFSTAIVLTPVVLLISLVVKKSDLQEMNYEASDIKKGNILLIAYIIASIGLLVLLILIKKGKL